MNNVPNSDSKQCPESKLGQVHSVHTLNPGYACTAQRPSAHATRWALLWPCLGRVVVWPLPRAHSAPCRAVAAPYRSVSLLYRSAWCAISRPKAAPLSATIQFLYRDPLLTRPRACALPHPLTCGRSCRGPCLGRIVGLPRPYRRQAQSCRGQVLACPCAPLPSLSQYSLLYCDSSLKSLAVAHLTAINFFFSHIFFLTFQLLGKPLKNNNFCFSISSKPNKLFKFILSIFFFSFTHYKTLEKFSSHHCFFFFLCANH